MPKSCASFAEVGQDVAYELVLVDNGSTDNTAEVLGQLLPSYPFARCVTIAANRGYGDGIFTGLKAARGQALAWSHADLQTDPQDVFRAFAAYRQAADPEKLIVKGRRHGRRVADRLISRGMEIAALFFLRTWLTEINAQPKVFHARLMECLTAPPVDFNFERLRALSGAAPRLADRDDQRRLPPAAAWPEQLGGDLALQGADYPPQHALHVSTGLQARLMRDFSPYFVALEPDDESLAKVLGWKRTVFDLVGPQLYLNDPPHLTLYLAIYGERGAESGERGASNPGSLLQAPCSNLHAAVAKLAGEIRLPPLEMAAWHVFEADVLTDRNTLVCDLSPGSRDALRCVQQAAVAAMAGLRDRGRTRARYDAAWQRLSDVERSNVESCGFPFVGPIWHPHVSIASIQRKDWAAVWPAFAAVSPAGPFRLPWMTLYRLEGNKPVLIDRWALGVSERGKT